MDIFGKKAAALENVIKSQTATIRRISAELATQRKLRDMDQLVFAMSQCTSWEQMRPIFLKLKTFTDQQMVDESDRIKNVLIPEMQKAYQLSTTNDQTPLVRSRFDVNPK